MEFQSIAQPTKNSTLQVIKEAFSGEGITQIDMAFAYATTGGVQDFIAAGFSTFGENWTMVPKRWIVSFDYLRSEPTALQMLSSLPNSNVRIYDASFVLANKGAANRPFHPKSVLIEAGDRQTIIAGSGNLSRSGLNRGYEAGLLISGNFNSEQSSQNTRASYERIRNWYDETWNTAEVLNEALLNRYDAQYQSASNLKNLVPTEDDYFPFELKANQLGPNDLRKLRACKHFWIESGNITKNLGYIRPGNQLMMKRLSRVFFGVPVADVPQNSPLKKIRIIYGTHEKDDCSLTFSDNGMDKLTLPIPGENGVPAFDNKTLLFERRSAGTFLLTVGTKPSRKKWLKQSKAIDANFKMSGAGRKWGVF